MKKIYEFMRINYVETNTVLKNKKVKMIEALSIFLFIFSFIFPQLGKSQITVPYASTYTVTCISDSIFDHAGGHSDYNDDADGYIVLDNSGSNLISISGTYDTESCCDNVQIYDGAGLGGTMLYDYFGTGTMTSFTSTPGQKLTIYFISDGSVTYSGFAMKVSYLGIPSISVSAMPSTTICSGQSTTLTANGATSYSWTSISTNTAITVSPIATTNYTVVGSNGPGTCSGSSIVTVNVNTTPLIIAISSTTLICKGESVILNATTTAPSYTWNTGGSTAISVSPSVTTTYTVSAVNLNGCAASANVNITVNACTGINEVVEASTSIYPNPNSGILNISLTNALSQNSSIEIYDGLSKLVLKETLSNELNTLNISNLENGLYIFKIINGSNAIKIGKLVKQ